MKIRSIIPFSFARQRKRLRAANASAASFLADRAMAKRWPRIKFILSVARFVGTRRRRGCRQHNDANVLSIGQRMIPEDLALKIVRVWLETPFEGGRHEKRVAQLNAM